MTKFLIYFSVLFSLIASNAFANNSETIKMNQPHTLTLDDVEFDKNTAEIKGYTADYKDIVIPDNFDGIPVVFIGNGAFEDSALTSVTIPNSVNEIGYEAFAKNALTSVTIPNSVFLMGSAAFYDNDLTSVTISNSLTEIGFYAFKGNALTSVIIPKSVTEIGVEAFYNNALTSVTIPNSVTFIGRDAFYNNALTSVTFPVTKIGGRGYPNFPFPVEFSSLTEIGNGAFAENALRLKWWPFSCLDVTRSRSFWAYLTWLSRIEIRSLGSSAH
jgi:hypothetical protein